LIFTGDNGFYILPRILLLLSDHMLFMMAD